MAPCTSPCLLLVIALALQLPQVSSPARILDISFSASKSHKIVYEPLILELAKRGHQITRITPYVSSQPTPNIIEMKTIDVDEILATLPNVFELRARGQEFDLAALAKAFRQICEQSFDLPQVRDFIARKETFDLVLAEAFGNECVAGILHHLNTSLILISPISAPPLITSTFGNPSLPSFIPNDFTGFGDRMTFFERVVNLLVEGLTRVFWKVYFNGASESVYREKMGDPNLPGVDEVFGNASLILSNGHFSLGRPAPLLPNIVQVGGMHCRPAKPLPKDLEDFLGSSDSDHGFIYFSMGSVLNATLMGDKHRKIFANTFAKLKQKILWKWESEVMEGLPPNVKLSKWVPQQDVLGHPKIKAFITHGGLGGVNEAVYHAVPLIGIPMFGDQPVNIKKAEKKGFAINLDFTTLSEETLMGAIDKIIGTPTYLGTVQHLSQLFRDQEGNPLDRAVYWTEYVLRHQGAPHLRSAAQELNFYQYYSLDVAAFLAGVFACVLIVVIFVIRCICRTICGMRKNLGADKKNK